MPSGDAQTVEVPWNDALVTANIPVVDYLALTSSDPATHKKELKVLEDAARTVGFFVFKNPPIDKQNLDRQFELAKELFELSADVKEPLNMGIKGEFG